LTCRSARGLGVVIGIEVDDVDEAAQRCRAAGCVITAGPLNAPWAERYVEFEDPYGYGWKFFKVRPTRRTTVYVPRVTCGSGRSSCR
jgi:uncharacterized glyoxalase superfamily protein PhnB